MYRLVRRVAVASLLALPATLVAQTRSVSPITKAEIDGYLRFLSSDLLEGRAPGTRGGQLAAQYIADQLRAFGVEPAVNGSYFQPVPIDVLTTRQSSVRASASGKATATLRPGQDVGLREQRPVRQPRVQRRLHLGRVRPEGRQRVHLHSPGRRAQGLRQQLPLRHRLSRRPMAVLPAELPVEHLLGQLLAG